jgi:aspartate/methionine/tyrosine aminotransferase
VSGGVELAKRVGRVRPSGIRRIFDLACNRRELLNLSIGEPDFDVPAPVKAEAMRWMERLTWRRLKALRLPYPAA